MHTRPEAVHALRKDNIFYPTPPTPFQGFIRNPILFIARWLYKHQPPISSPPTSKRMPRVKVCCISDTHNEIPEVPNGDILLHAGDLTQNGSFNELQAQLDWLKSLHFEHKIVIAGNHELILDPTYVFKGSSHEFSNTNGQRREDLEWYDAILLFASTVSLRVRRRTINIFGSPMTPKYGNWAFQYPHEKDIWANRIPSGTDVVLAHGPPKGHLDRDGAGCKHLNRELWRVQPRLVVFGHIHVGRGQEDVCWDAVQRMYDAAVGCDIGGFGAFELGVLAWVWYWILYLLIGWKREGKTTLVNAAVVGDGSVASGTVVDI